MNALKRSEIGLVALAGVTALLTTATAAPPRAEKPASKTSAPRKPGVNVEIADVPRLEKAIAGQRGKVTVVNFWATWCTPCVGEFPDLVHLYNVHKAEGLTLLSVSVDATTDRTGKVIPFLKEKKATFPAFIKAAGDDSAFVTAIDANWEGSVPRTYLLDRNGRVRKVYTGAISPPEVEKVVRELLAEKPNTSSPAAPTAPAEHPHGLLGL